MIEVYDRALRKRAVLNNAFDKHEEEKLNEAGTLKFSLPGDDPKTAHCGPFSFVRSDAGIFYRVLLPETKRKDYETCAYTAEHCIATLVDDVMFRTTVIGGAGMYTRDVIQYILGQQSVRRWRLGECDFDKQFEYGFESENLYNALMSVPNLFVEPYMWTYDFTAYPWTVSLKRLDRGAKPQFYIRDGKNLIEANGARDGSEVCTRLYLLGFGEGDNQLGIEEVNGGLPYIQSPQAYIDKYGLISKVYVDRSFEDAASLLARGRALLEAMQEPPYTRSLTVADLYKITGQRYDHAAVGDVVRIAEDGSTAFVTGVSRNLDVDGDMDIELSTKAADIVKDVADLADRQRIEQVYSQGATQIYSQSIQANADSKTPAVLNFFIPQEMRIINKVAAKISIESFRSYSRMTSSGGSHTSTSSDGGGSQQTSQAAGASTVASTNDGDTTLSENQRVVSVGNETSMPLVGGYQTSVTQMSTTDTTGSTSGTTGSASGSTGMNSTAYTSYNGHVEGGTHRHSLESHTHSLNSHTHSVPSHAHSIPAHQHGFNHNHNFTVSITIPGHTHQVPRHSHSVTIPAHQHSVSIPAHNHTVDIPLHTHDIVQGIFRFGSPSGAQIQINGATKGTMEREREIDLTPYLLSDSGKIPRGSWIRLGILPNDLAYVTIDIYVQGFVQSRGGGTY